MWPWGFLAIFSMHAVCQAVAHGTNLDVCDDAAFIVVKKPVKKPGHSCSKGHLYYKHPTEEDFDDFYGNSFQGQRGFGSQQASSSSNGFQGNLFHEQLGFSGQQGGSFSNGLRNSPFVQEATSSNDDRHSCLHGLKGKAFHGQAVAHGTDLDVCDDAAFIVVKKPGHSCSKGHLYYKHPTEEAFDGFHGNSFQGQRGFGSQQPTSSNDGHHICLHGFKEKAFHGQQEFSGHGGSSTKCGSHGSTFGQQLTSSNNDLQNSVQGFQGNGLQGQQRFSGQQGSSSNNRFRAIASQGQQGLSTRLGSSSINGFQGTALQAQQGLNAQQRSSSINGFQGNFFQGQLGFSGQRGSSSNNGLQPSLFGQQPTSFRDGLQNFLQGQQGYVGSFQNNGNTFDNTGLSVQNVNPGLSSQAGGNLFQTSFSTLQDGVPSFQSPGSNILRSDFSFRNGFPTQNGITPSLVSDPGAKLQSSSIQTGSLANRINGIQFQGLRTTLQNGVTPFLSSGFNSPNSEFSFQNGLGQGASNQFSSSGLINSNFFTSQGTSPSFLNPALPFQNSCCGNQAAASAFQNVGAGISPIQAGVSPLLRGECGGLGVTPFLSSVSPNARFSFQSGSCQRAGNQFPSSGLINSNCFTSQGTSPNFLNPVLPFQNSCFGNQAAASAFLNVGTGITPIQTGVSPLLRGQRAGVFRSGSSNLYGNPCYKSYKPC